LNNQAYSVKAPDKVKRLCPQCEEEMPVDAVICVSCGLNLATGKSLTTIGPTAKISLERLENIGRYLEIIRTVACVLACIMIVFLLLYPPKPGTRKVFMYSSGKTLTTDYVYYGFVFDTGTRTYEAGLLGGLRVSGYEAIHTEDGSKVIVWLLALEIGTAITAAVLVLLFTHLIYRRLEAAAYGELALSAEDGSRAEKPVP